MKNPEIPREHDLEPGATLGAARAGRNPLKAERVGLGAEPPGPALRALRLERGFTRDRLAEVAGVAVHWVASYENGRCEPPAAVLNRLLRALEASPADLRRALEAHRHRDAAREPSRHLPPYTALVHRSEADGLYVAEVPELGAGCAARGATVEEALRLAAEQVVKYLEDMVRFGDSPPEPRRYELHRLGAAT